MPPVLRASSTTAAACPAVRPVLPQLVAYGGEDGEVGVFKAEYEANSKRRMPHTAVAGAGEPAAVGERLARLLCTLAWPGEWRFGGRAPDGPHHKWPTPARTAAGCRMEGVALAVKTPQQMGRVSSLFAGKVVERGPSLKGARLPGGPGQQVARGGGGTTGPWFGGLGGSRAGPRSPCMPAPTLRRPCPVPHARTDAAEAIHRVAWSRSASLGAWLASGGAAGLVRCQWIQAA